MDSTHITNGVVTGGWVHDAFKIEVSALHGGEPDQRRFNIEPAALDSVAARVSWNPTANISLQTSWGRVVRPEQLEPTVNEDRFTAGAIYTRRLGDSGWWSTTLALGSKRKSYGQTLSGVLLESALHPTGPWTLFARVESEQDNELLAAGEPAMTVPHPTAAFGVSKISFGAIHDWSPAPNITVGLGALYDFDFVPAALRSAYGSDPHGTMAFVRLKMD
jgi:hypothetical protein